MSVRSTSAERCPSFDTGTGLPNNCPLLLSAETGPTRFRAPPRYVERAEWSESADPDGEGGTHEPGLASAFEEGPTALSGRAGGSSGSKARPPYTELPEPWPLYTEPPKSSEAAMEGEKVAHWSVGKTSEVLDQWVMILELVSFMPHSFESWGHGEANEPRW